MLQQAVWEILLFSSLLALTSTALRRVIITKEDMMAMQEVQRFNRELMTALRQKDKKAIERLEKRKEYMQRMQTRILGKNMLLMVLSMAIFFSFFFYANARYQGLELLKMPPGLEIPFISSEGKILFFGWYLLTFFAVSLPINKFFWPTNREPRYFRKPAEEVSFRGDDERQKGLRVVWQRDSRNRRRVVVILQ
jgi:uncharacterized membrane protein (DUF106 family)